MPSIEEINNPNIAMVQDINNRSHDPQTSEFADVNGMGTLAVIGEDQVKEAFETLKKYKAEKSNLEKRLEENEEFWKLNHWRYMSTPDDERIHPKSAWCVNTIINKHADAMDNYPTANILPRAKDDEFTAKVLSKVIPVILEQNEFEQTYSDVQWYKQKNGTGVYGVFWNNDKAHGLGDIDVVKADLGCIYWKGGVKDIQDSPNLFVVNMMELDQIKEMYPNLDVKGGNSEALGSGDIYLKDENIDTTSQVAVIDWYYKKKSVTVDMNGITRIDTILHYVKFCEGKVIYASENDPLYAEKGWYSHGKYPYVFDVLYPVESSVCGMGYIDLVKDNQMFVDKLQQGILENAAWNARPRIAVRTDSGINEEEFADINNTIVHFTGNLGEDAFRDLTSTPMSPIYETIYLNKVQEMKDTSGNTASSQGQTSNVTSASGIASLQEASGKLGRDANKTSYRAFKCVVDMVIELIRQFYDEPRCFRISGDMGQNEYVMLDNTGLNPLAQGNAYGIDLGNRLPIMDIDVKPQKKSAYSKESQNQTALNLYGMGFFNPTQADASLATLDMMDFDGIEKVKENISRNQTLYEMLVSMQQMALSLAQMVDSTQGTNYTEQIGQMALQTNGAVNSVANSGSIDESKGSLSTQAAAATRGSASPV